MIASVVLWMTGALVCFVVAALCIRRLGLALGAFEINLVRTGGGLVLLGAALVLRPSLGSGLPSHQPVMHLLRNSAHATGGLLWTLSIGALPLATVFSLEFTAPAWAALLAFPILGERIGRHTGIGVLASFLGVLIVLRPTPSSFDLVSLLPVGAAVCFGLSVLLTRRLTRTETTFAILLYMMALQMPLNLAGALAVGHGGLAALTAPPVALAGLGLVVAGLGSQLCLARALTVGEAMLVIPLDFLRVPLIAVIGWAVYDEPIDLWVGIGFLVIVAGIVTGLSAAARPVAE